MVITSIFEISNFVERLIPNHITKKIHQFVRQAKIIGFNLSPLGFIDGLRRQK